MSKQKKIAVKIVGDRTLSPNDAHLQSLYRTLDHRTRTIGRVYYSNGNFFYPTELSDNHPGLVRGAIARFEKANKALIEKDRKDPNYVPFEDLFDLKPGQVVANEDGSYTILSQPEGA